MTIRAGVVEIFTVGHSTHDQETFARLVKAHGIEVLVDVRSIPFSRRQPHFNQYRLEDAHTPAAEKSRGGAIHHPEDKIMPVWLLAEAGARYVHMPKLGGRRGKTHGATTENAAWANRSFRNYADYTATVDFRAGLSELINLAQFHRVAYMCSERHPSQCHRSIISDNLTASGLEVRHILPCGAGSSLCTHVLGAWGAAPTVRENSSGVAYPPPSEQLALWRS